MDFWRAQREARKKTALYVLLFCVMTISVAIGAEWMLREWAARNYHPPVPWVGGAFIGGTLAVALFNYLMVWGQGGGYVARSLGGRRIVSGTANFAEKQLYNICEEIALASGVPMPEVYLLDTDSINAFAAGLSPNQAAIAITRGALQLLNRAEIQGVIAHEFGHIRNGDMRLGVQLATMVMGFFFIMYLGFRLLQFSAYAGGQRGENGRNRGGNPILFAAVAFVAAGAICWFFGKVLRSMVSCQREYLADASAVEFTRQTAGIRGALEKIKAHTSHQQMPKEGGAYAHLYFDNRSFMDFLFATHPPLEKRIAALSGVSAY